MEKQEIKKAYQKMSRQLKRQGLNYTCVMNARQQELRTATICIGYVMNYEEEIEKAAKNLEDTAGTEKEVRASMKSAAHYLPMWRKWAEEGGSNAEYWKELVEAWDTETYEDKCRKEIAERKEKQLNYSRENFANYGTVKEQKQKIKDKYEKLLAASPVVEFMEITNARTVMEYKTEHGTDFYYMRFYY